MKVVLQWQPFRFSPTGKQWLAYKADGSPLCIGAPTIDETCEKVLTLHPLADIEVGGQFVYQEGL